MKMGEISLTASLAWVAPVRPDKLGPHLKAFEETVPVLHALRLCHRFGKGPDVHITKLPAELELIIEELCLHPTWCRATAFEHFDWEADFRCFESRCSPLSHMGDCTPLWEQVTDNFNYCDSCPDFEAPFDHCEVSCKNSHTADPCETCKAGTKGTCEKSCDGQIHEEQMRAAAECDWWYEDHVDTRYNWSNRINAKQVEQMNVVLRQHFGLEAAFSDTRPESTDPGSWPKDRNYRWHVPEQKETTICHLTIPRRKIEKSEWVTSDFEDEMGSFSIEGTQTLEFNTDCYLSRADVTRRFQKAMTYLGLAPSPHASQRYSKPRLAAAEPARDATVAAASSNKDDQKVQPIPKCDWPKLVLMLTANTCAPY
ncbi:unnamed protein product [Zymoseptoria tritici ST99CH_3D1]|nr:unnamed protein product [Zymoseptoria tritici ST99CH_3D1]